MKYCVFFLSVLSFYILSCNTNPATSFFATPETVIADAYTIDINRDTTLVTKNGALLKIPKGSLQTDNGTTVSLEIKEAYTIQQMIRAGLTTKSNGEALSSGGMIYINAAAGQKVTIRQGIRVAIPADYLNKDMQLYKGEKDKNGNINWINPEPLPRTGQQTAIEKGSAIFQARCASCHQIGEELSGPDLAHFPRRIPNSESTSKYWYHDFSDWQIPIRAEYLESEGRPYDQRKPDTLYGDRWVDLYSCNLIRLFKTAVNLNRSDSTSLDFSSVYNFIQNESDRRYLPLPKHAYLYDCVDSCNLYKKTIDEFTAQKEEAANLRKELVLNNGALVQQKKLDTAQSSGSVPLPPPPPNFDKMVSPESFNSVYYQFTIETFGWFNVDVLIKGMNGVEESELFVRVAGQYRDKIQVYLVIPSVKVYLQGGRIRNDADVYAFINKNGSIPLPQLSNAWILAVTETTSSIAFALKEFTTSTRQEVEISLKESTTEEFNTAINAMGGTGVTIGVKDSKNASEIRQKESDLKVIDVQLKKAEELKPKNCDCNCSPGYPTAAK